MWQLNWLLGKKCDSSSQSRTRSARESAASTLRAAKVRPSRPRTRLTLQTLESREVPSVNNPIVAENQLPGNPESEWMVAGDGDTTLQGFSTDISVNHGQTINFKINDSAQAPYHIDIYRLGYYQGNGARKVASIPSSVTSRTVQPGPLFDSTTNLVDAGNWSVAASWGVPSTAVSGLYIARLVREDTGGASLIFFVVRDDGGHSDMLFQTSDSTWEAYNHWGGESVYQGTDGDFDDRAVKVSYNRPLTLAGVQGGFGSYNSPLHAEYPMIRWLESNGYNLSYSTDVDSDRNGALIKDHKVFMSVGHDEYWSGQQRTNVEAARDAGVNLAFFSGNEVYWKTRWETSIDGSGTAYRTLVTYKESKDNARTDPMDISSGIWTGTWRDARFSPPADGGRPENALSGTMYMNDRTSSDLGIPMQVPSTYAGLRFWRNTSVANLQPGQVATLGDRIVGYETDEDVDNGFRPAGLFDLSATTFTTSSHVLDPAGVTVGPGTSTQQMTMYRAPSGALVFGAGTVQWSWGLDGHHIDGTGTPSRDIQQATLNLLADMGAQPGSIQAGLVAATMSLDLSRPTSVVTAPAAGTVFQAGVPVTVTGTAADSGGGVVSGVEVSTDGGRTWHKASGGASWSYVWTPTVTGPATILSRAADDSANVEIPSGGVPVTVRLQPTSTTGLVAAFGFNDSGAGQTFADASGSGNNATNGGATPVANGMFGTPALSFNGTNSWLTIPDSPTLDLTSAMTLEAWVQPAAVGNWEAILLKERAGGLDYGLYASTGTGQPAAYFNSTPNVVGPAGLPVGSWSYLTATYDGAKFSLYVNGALVSSQSVSGSIITSDGALRIGGDSVWGEYFSGLIDEVRVYNRALSSAEIQSDMTTPIGGTVDPIAPTAVVAATVPGGSVSGAVTLSATASDNIGVAGVQFLVNGQPVGAEITAAPYTYVWDTTKVLNGIYSVSARVRDVAGNTSVSAAVNYTISNLIDATGPTVSLTGLAANTPVTGTVILSALASDNIGVVGVQFKANGVNIGSELTTAPYRVAWNATGLSSGTYQITAVARDSQGNTTTSAAVPTIVDTTPPAVTAQSPAPSATVVATSLNPTVTFSKPVDPNSLGIVLTDPAGNPVATTLSYDDTANTATIAHASALAPLTTYTVTVKSATDLVGNVMAAPYSWSFTTDSIVTGSTLFGPADVPATAAASDGSALELGVKFRSSVAGVVTGVRFYKGTGNTGTHVGHLWDAAGNLLATATFTSETASGWQEAAFSAPVAIQANTTYVASYYAPVGHYSFTGAYFTTALARSPLTALATGQDGGNGVFRSAVGGGFPNQTYNANNYWVDVVFNAAGGGNTQDTVAPTVAAQTPAAGATGVAVGSAVTVTFSEPVQATTISFALADGGGNAVPATVSYDPNSLTATLTPSSSLAIGATYTATVSGVTDLAGNVMTAPYSWSFTTPTPVTSASLWPVSTAPANPSWADSNPIEIGLRFSSDVAGQITGLRFYKGAGNTGTHVGHLWTNDGTLLATATFTSETASGWQQVTFASPVTISPNTLYIASYYAPVGHYAVSSGYFASTGVDSSPLHAPADGVNGGNGLFLYATGGGFPGNSYNSANYWVDVLFNQITPDTSAPIVSGVTPANSATGVLPSAPITFTFDRAVQPATIALQVKDSFGNLVTGNLSYDSGTQTATFIPVTPLQSFLTYTATVSGMKDLSGNTQTVPFSWWFRTQGIWLQSTVADFSSGSNDGTVVTNTSGGEIRLAQLVQDDFSSTTLDGTKWTISSWTSAGGGQTSVTPSNGILSVAGAAVYSGQSYTNTPLEGRVAFGAVANQHFGLATGLATVAGNYWAIFSTRQTTNHLYARVNSNGTTTDVDLGALPTGFHLYRVQPIATGFQFYVDDVLKTTINATFQTTRSLKAALSAFSATPVLQVDSVRFISTSSTQTGVFTSGILQLAQVVDWNSATWTANLPAGTSIKVETSSSLDGTTWTDWQEVVGGSIASPNGKYLRYRITLTTTDPSVSPVLSDISLTWN